MEVLLKKLNVINKTLFRMIIEFIGYNKKKFHVKILDYFFLACLKKKKKKTDFLFRGIHCFHWVGTGSVSWQYWSNGRWINFVHSIRYDVFCILVILKVVWHINGDLCFIKSRKLFSVRDRSAAVFHGFSASLFARQGIVRTVFSFQLLHLGMHSQTLWCNSIYNGIKLEYLFKIGRSTFLSFFIPFSGLTVFFHYLLMKS